MRIMVNKMMVVQRRFVFSFISFLFSNFEILFDFCCLWGTDKEVSHCETSF